MKQSSEDIDLRKYALDKAIEARSQVTGPSPNVSGPAATELIVKAADAFHDFLTS